MKLLQQVVLCGGDLHDHFRRDRLDVDGDGEETGELQAFYCVTTNVKYAVFALNTKHSDLFRQFHKTCQVICDLNLIFVYYTTPSSYV